MNKRSSQYRPQFNGAVEIANKALLAALQKCVGEHPDTWDEQLALILLALRSAAHHTTRFSPFYLNTGRNVRLPAQALRGIQQVASDDITTSCSALLDAAATQKPPDGAKPGMNFKAVLGTAPPTITRQKLINPRAELTSLEQPRKVPKLSDQAVRACKPEVVEISDSTLKTEPKSELDSGTARLIQNRHGMQQLLHEELRTNVQRAQEKQSRDYHKRHLHVAKLSTAMPPGSLVLMLRPSSNKLAKLSTREGPYRVIKYDKAEANCLLEDGAGKRWFVHVACVCPVPADWRAVENAE